MLGTIEIQEISRYQPFDRLGQSTLEKMGAQIRREEYKANEELFYQGQDSTKFYFVLSGLVTLSRVSIEGMEKVMDIIEPGQTIAETSLFLDDPKHVVTAKAVTDTIVYAFKLSAMKEYLVESPTCCMQFLSALSQKCVDSMLEIESITMDSAVSRVASYLVKKTDNTSVRVSGKERVLKLPVQKQLLASRLAITPETLSRIFNKFRKENLISIHGQEVQIPDVLAIKQRYLAC